MTDMSKEPWGYVVFVKEIIDGSGYTCPHTGEEILDTDQQWFACATKAEALEHAERCREGGDCVDVGIAAIMHDSDWWVQPKADADV